MESRERRTTLWMATAQGARTYAQLGKDITVDVCIVGAGIAGMTTAYELSKDGLIVAVLDDGPIGSGQTRRTTAHLSTALDDRYYELERIHGKKTTRLAMQSHSQAIDRIAEICEEVSIDCNFERVDGYLFAAKADDAEILHKELEAARTAGLDVAMVPRAPIDSFDTGEALRFPAQAQFHPLRYLAGLARAVVERGGHVHESTHVVDIEGGPEAKVRTDGGFTVRCEHVVVATNSPINERIAIHTKQAPYMSYVIAAPLPHETVEHALFWDTEDPYHYVRVQREEEHDLLIVGGEDHRTGDKNGTGDKNDPDARYAALEKWARARFPLLGETLYRWSGQVMETIDGLAFIGRAPHQPDNVYLATGDSGMGMTHGTIAGMLLADLIAGRENAFTEIYDPKRKPLRAAGEYMKENLHSAGHVVDWLSRGDVKSVDQIVADSGGVVRRGLKKLAVYRDEHGQLHERSAACPHLGCVVAWNDGEKTWDCPCHGSRFDRFGEVLSGPANSGLSAVKRADDDK